MVFLMFPLGQGIEKVTEYFWFQSEYITRDEYEDILADKYKTVTTIATT